jgi:hypothetical protein
LAFLTPAERAELDRLIARPTSRQIVETMPIHVLRTVVDSIDRGLAAEGNGAKVNPNEIASLVYITLPPGHRFRDRSVRLLGNLDLPETLKDQIKDAFVCGYWRGDWQPANGDEVKMLASWLEDNHRLIDGLGELVDMGNYRMTVWNLLLRFRDHMKMMDKGDKSHRWLAWDEVKVARALQARYGSKLKREATALPPPSPAQPKPETPKAIPTEHPHGIFDPGTTGTWWSPQDFEKRPAYH